VSLLRRRGLGPLLCAEVVSSLGSQMTYLALPWFVLVTTHSATRMGVVLGVELLPTALLGIPSGAVVARLGARRTMMVADAARVPLMASIPFLHAAGALSFPVLLAIVFVIGCFLAPHFSATAFTAAAQPRGFTPPAFATTLTPLPTMAGRMLSIAPMKSRA